MPDRKIVLVSSTTRDLPKHRKEVIKACQRKGMFPQMMENLPAADADAIAESLRLVDEADIYLGVFAYRYGYVPKGYNISITEMEYNRAVERGIPRLIFLMHKDHPLKAEDVETGEGAQKLNAFKERIAAERVVSFFKSPDDLRANVGDSLSHYRERDMKAFHYVSDLQKPPEIYIAHQYTLLQTRDLVGRQQELNLLTDWVTKRDSLVYQARILNIVAIGGIGKSALTWKWFNDIAPNEMKSMAGRMWWSFYESDATFENFIIRALAYVTGRAREDVEKNTKSGEREEMLLATLDREPFLLVLDGLERILIAYARMDANRLADDDLDQQAANFVAGAMGLPESAAQSFIGQHRLRKTADPRAGNFLRKLSRVRASRILVSTRLYPADLQNVVGKPIPGSHAHFIRGLSDDDALSLWRAFGVSGSRDELLRLFHVFDSHPLLIQALAGEIAHDHRAAGDFDRWQNNHPEFDPFSLPLVQARSHILEFALRGLNEAARKALYTIAAFRMPATYDTLVAILTDEDNVFSNENAIDAELTELEDRGLMGWNKLANSYDLHPLVRGVIWSGLDDVTKQETYLALLSYFAFLPIDTVNTLEDIISSIELYNALIGLRLYDDALVVFQGRLENVILKSLSVSLQHVELLEMLFPLGTSQLPHLSDSNAQAYALNALALAYNGSGQPGRAIPLFRRSNDLNEQSDELDFVSVYLCNFADALRLSGWLRASEAAAYRALLMIRKQRDHFQEGVGLLSLGMTLAARGIEGNARIVLKKALRIFVSKNQFRFEMATKSSFSQWAFWLHEYEYAKRLAEYAWEPEQASRYENDFIRATRLQGVAALGMKDLGAADEHLHRALTRTREINFIEEEIQALIALAELRRQQGDSQAAHEFLDDVWEAAERGPYPLFHADALNVLAQIERDEGNTDKAVQAATEAYRKAWCDGPPFAYHWGLEAARKHLAELGAPEPTDLPPYDESKYEPMPDVEIDPPDLPVDKE